MKNFTLAAVLMASAVLSTGCAAEAVTGAAAAKAAQGQVQAAGPVDSMVQAKQRIEAKAYSARIVAEHESMMAGQEWKVTGGGWTAGAAVTVTLTSAAGAAVGAQLHAVADAQGHIDAAITPPAGTPTGPYTLVAVAPADGSGPHTAPVNIFAQ